MLQELEDLAGRGRVEQAVALALTCPPGPALWDELEKVGEPALTRYWREVPELYGTRFPAEPMVHLERAIGAMLHVGNLKSAFETAVHGRANLSPRVLLDVVKHTIRHPTVLGEIENVAYWLHPVFDQLSSSPAVPNAELVPLAVAYIVRFSDGAQLPVLSRLFEKDPRQFVNLIGMCCRKEGEEQRDPTETEAIQAANAGQFLSHWRGVPGEDRQSAEERTGALFDWATTVLAIAREEGLARPTGSYVAEILARAPPDSDGSWPNRAARRLLEGAEGPCLAEGLSIARRNARGGTTRDLGAGGRLERALASRYRREAQRMAEWPATQRLLQQLAEYYERDAVRHDEQTRANARSWGIGPLGVLPLDILVLLKLAALDNRRRGGEPVAPPDAASVGCALGIDQDEVAVAFSTLQEHGFLRRDASLTPDRLRVRAFLKAPTPVSARVDRGKRGKGLPTGPSAPALAKHLEPAEQHVMGLPEGVGTGRDLVEGILVPPIDPHAPAAAAKDPALYELLSLYDVLRVLGPEGGQARALALARQGIEEFFNR